MTNNITKLDFTFLSEWQKKAFAKIKKHRYNLLIIHRRAGKSVLAISYLIYKALLHPNKDLGYLAPMLNQSKSIAFEYLKKFVSQIPWTSINNTELTVRFSNWSSIRLFWWDAPDTLRWLNLSTIVIDEYDDIRSELFSKIIFPQINFHGELWQVIFLGTPKWKKQLYKLWNKTKEDPKRYNLKLSVEDSWVLSEELIAEAAEQLNPSQLAQEYYCSFEAAVRWSYYAEYIETLYSEERVQSDLYDPNLPVTVHFDLWISDATAIVYTQYIDDRVMWIDYDEFTWKGFPYFISLFKSKGYNYDTFYGPHDMAVREYTWMTRLETFRRLINWMGEVQLIPRQSIEDGINSVRDMFPHLYIDSSLEQQIDRLSQYEAKWDEKKQVFTKPIHNEFSHISDAIRYTATTYMRNTEVTTYIPPFTQNYEDLF